MASTQRFSRNPGQVLDQARQAVKSREYERALALYDWFFDHALDDDPAAFYGVRLSYCLHEWADLGKMYPAAKAQLEFKRQTSLALLETTREPERFHDYVAISNSLGVPDQLMTQFLTYHDKDSRLAEEIVRFIWNQLVEFGQWSVCSRYVPDAQAHYERKLLQFDEGMAVCNTYPEVDREELAGHLKRFCIRDMRNLLLVLAHDGRSKELLAIQDRLVKDMDHRQLSDVSAAALEDLKN